MSQYHPLYPPCPSNIRTSVISHRYYSSLSSKLQVKESKTSPTASVLCYPHPWNTFPSILSKSPMLQFTISPVAKTGVCPQPNICFTLNNSTTFRFRLVNHGFSLKSVFYLALLVTDPRFFNQSVILKIELFQPYFRLLLNMKTFLKHYTVYEYSKQIKILHSSKLLPERSGATINVLLHLIRNSCDLLSEHTFLSFSASLWKSQLGFQIGPIGPIFHGLF